jgi:methylated-DNA-[protein]-cysteine S-methyltransferase
MLRLIVETLFFFRTPSPVGPLFLAASAKGLVRLEFESRMQKLDPRVYELRESQSAVRPYLRELDEYFAGTRRDFSLPLDLRGTSFQLACWNALLEIPYGETRSYGDMAKMIGHPKAFRAVGMSNNRNPIAIIVPCHRVIASSGSLCGYGGGLELKSWLLDLEQRNIPSSSGAEDETLVPGQSFAKERARRSSSSGRPRAEQPCLPLRMGA